MEGQLFISKAALDFWSDARRGNVASRQLVYAAKPLHEPQLSICKAGGLLHLHGFAFLKNKVQWEVEAEARCSVRDSVSS